MRYSKVLSQLAAVLLLLVMAGCANVGSKKSKDKTDDTKEEGVEIPFVLIPNPYVPGTVPEPAKREYTTIKGLMSEKKWAQAKGLLNLMVETYPNLSGPYINLGIVHHILGEHEQAEKALNFAIETNPNNLDAYARLGFLYRELGRFSDAEATYLKALAIWPHHLASTRNLGILYDLYMGRFDDALRYYQLSQKITGGEDRELKGWIVDLQRRMKTP
ncbi:MAG: tetratricopeptide repeat protein [Agarilytica sp.]